MTCKPLKDKIVQFLRNGQTSATIQPDNLINFAIEGKVLCTMIFKVLKANLSHGLFFTEKVPCDIFFEHRQGTIDYEFAFRCI
ncbi:hypothetical protein A6A04_20485 [Paramagnetospirillum marisnigri]|uniref:Uncharacterized protein n=1 Tax=Paramagnetospirillum marisnigri TaxID=1285242 RepID=A0A178MG39_9PROT|nr:hypothetical protein A6A04_20485 [Paramagnetospirillum marisnigri]CAA7626715.1 conserved hypothetical protein [Magnetospirillum sp. SS-4]